MDRYGRTEILPDRSRTPDTAVQLDFTGGAGMVTHEKELAYCGDRIVTIKDGRVLDNVLLGEDEKAENRRRLFGDVTSGDIAEPETTVPEEKKPAARQAKAVAAAVAEKVNQESM